MTKVSGKTALVTGASRGIGRASALALAKMGAHVLVHYSSGEKEAEAVVEEIDDGVLSLNRHSGDIRSRGGHSGHLCDWRTIWRRRRGIGLGSIL